MRRQPYSQPADVRLAEYDARRRTTRAQLLDEHPPQLLELHELELHELDELQLDDEQLLSDASNELPLPAFAATSDDIRDAVCTVCEYTDHAVPANAAVPNSAAVHSSGSGSPRSRSCVCCAACVSGVGRGLRAA
uniref:hypothetical protein n=1 Tax=Burkholderia sp. LMG 13014 TaxID=2709306 RepID=UPI0019635EF8